MRESVDGGGLGGTLGNWNLGNELMMDDVLDDIDGGGEETKGKGGGNKLSEPQKSDLELVKHSPVPSEGDRGMGFGGTLGDVQMGNQLMMDDIVENIETGGRDLHAEEELDDETSLDSLRSRKL